MPSTGPPPESESTTGLLDLILEELRAGRAPDIDRLAAEYGEDPEEVRQLISVVQVVQTTADRSDPSEELDARLALPGRRPVLGDFRIEREIGRGGMGVVYEANQLSLNRRVALKVLLPGVSLSRRALARFQREFQTAGSLHHTHIVPVYAVGECDGVHYYAMQFIEGRSLAATIKQSREQRFRPDAAYYRRIARWGMQIADGLDYAHQRGVIHRDVKPANIMRDAEDNIWLTDFGLARQDDQQTITEGEDLLGTARYMAPEQARGGSSEIDERTDIYSLGVTLYELATLHPPFDGPDREAILRQVIQDIPRRPTRTCGVLPRELETIILKTLEKDPERRYMCAALVAEDLRRFLAGEPLLAQRPTIFEEAVRFVRRHAALVALVMSAFVVLLAFAIWMSVLYAQVGRNYDRAIRAEGDAQREAATAKAAAASLVNLFQSFDLNSDNPLSEPGEGTLSTHDLLARSVARVRADFAQLPATRAELLLAIASVHSVRGEYQVAASLAGEAVGAAREVQPPNVDLLSTALRRTAMHLRARGDRVQALSAAREALAIEDNRAAPISERRTSIVELVSDLLRELGHYAEAEALLDETCTSLARQDGEAGLLWEMEHRLALVRQRMGRIDQAERGLLAAHEALARIDGPDSVEAASVLLTLANLYVQRGDLDAATRAAGEAEAVHARKLGAIHSLRSVDLMLLARIASLRGDDEAAIEIGDEAVRVRRAVDGADLPGVASTLTAQANLLARARAYDRAIAAAREAMRVAQLTGDEDCWNVIQARRSLIDVLIEAGKGVEAVPLALEGLARYRAAYPEDYSGVVEELVRASNALDSAGREAEAEPLLRETFEILSANPSILVARNVVTKKILLARLVRPRDPVEAEQLFRAALRDMEDGDPEWTDLWKANTLVDLAWTLLQQGRAEDAEPFSAEGVESVELLRGDDAITFGKALAVRGLVLLALDRPVEVEQVMRRCLALREHNLPSGHYLIATSKSILGEALVRLGNLDEAEPMLCAAADILRARFPAEHEFVVDNERRLGMLADARAQLSDASVSAP